ncbi:MAG: FHA domain-containing protein [Pseudomonadota bacterium]
MKFFGGILGKSSSEETPKAVEGRVPQKIFDGLDETPLRRVPNAQPKRPRDFASEDYESDDMEDVNLSTIETVIDSLGKPRASNDVNIWDIDENGDSEEDLAPPQSGVAMPVATPPAPAPEIPATNAAAARARRNRTRLIGFDTSSGGVVNLFGDADKTAPTERVQFPVGWVLVVDGPGRGHCFALTAGMAQIGRDEDQAIQLDFGDSAISRNNHAAIVFDPESNDFLLGHGGKANIVRLNGKPVISNETLGDGDTIAIGETVLQLKTLCGPEFSWDSNTPSKDDDDDMAIA